MRHRRMTRHAGGAVAVLLLALALTIPGGTGAAAAETGAWQRHRAPVDEPLHRIFFLDDRTGWILTYGGGTVLQTRDGGASWRVQARVAADFLEAVRFVDADNGWLAGDYGTVFRSTDGELDNGVLYQTADGGLHWRRDALELPAPHAIALAPSKIWIVGKEGLLLSRDRGAARP